MLGTVVLYGLGAYVVDVLLRPEVVRRCAVAAARRRGKPLLNVGAGTPGSSLRVALLGPATWGDVNADLAGVGPGGPDHVGYADVQRLPYPTKAFGAAIASHLLEHVEDPHRALGELQRVADEVFIVCPRWWAPHTWLHPGHRWYLRRDGTWRRIR